MFTKINSLLLVLVSLSATCHHAQKKLPDMSFTISSGTFERKIHIIITEDTTKVMNELLNNFEETMTGKEILECAGITFFSDDYILVWLKNRDPDIINHELLHVTFHIIQDVNIPLTPDTEEIFTYELQFLSNQVYQKVWPTQSKGTFVSP